MKLLIDDEKIEAVVEKAFSDDAILEHRVNDRGHWEEITQIIAQAELDYLVELGIVYVEVTKPCPVCSEDSSLIYCRECDCKGVITEYIPLSDYKGDS